MSKIIKSILTFVCVFIIGMNFINAQTLDCSTTLKQGSSGYSVSVLQAMLNETTSCNLDVDGVFGKKTFSCVAKFQSNNKLNADGIVGSKTCQKLNSVANKNVKPAIVVVGDSVNIRTNAGTNYKKITTVNLGKTFSVYGTKKVNGTTWYKIKINGKYGYISGNYAKKNCILVDISEQKLIYYKNGQDILDTSIVTGTKGKHDTPVGHYTLKVANKTTAKTLRGTNDDGTKYASYVDYWMPFITSRGIGFHDASWRSSFGGSIYKTSGSHGCVNMPKESAKILYSNVETDVDVVVIA